MTKIDLTNIKGFEPVPNGKYVAAFTRATNEVAKSGTKGVKLVFNLRDEEYANRTIFHQMYFSEKSIAYFLVFCDYLGVTDEEKSEFDDDNPVALLREHYGKLVNVNVYIDNYVDPVTGDTKVSNKVKSISGHSSWSD